MNWRLREFADRRVTRLVAGLTLGLALGYMLGSKSVFLPLVGSVSGLWVAAVGLVPAVLLARHVSGHGSESDCGCSSDCDC